MVPMTKLSFNKIAAFALLFGMLYLSPIGAQQNSSSRATAAAKNPDRDSLAVKALRAEPGKPSLYEVSFVTSDSLATNAAIVVTFPREFDLSQLEIAGSSTINGGFTLERKGQEVRLRRTGLGAKIPPGKKVSIQFGLIGNPLNFSASHQVRVQLPPPGGAPSVAARPSGSTERLDRARRGLAEVSPKAATTKNMDVQFISPVK
jgi:hypothetical protein